MMAHRSFRMVVAVVAVVAAMAAFFPATAAADSAYHTERLTFDAISADESGSGMVINIHPNGPVNGALERYQLKKATPNTDYEVWLQVADADFAQTATIRTDGKGNGHAQAGFTADELAPFAGAVLPVRWVLRTEAGDAYATAITTVTLD